MAHFEETRWINRLFVIHWIRWCDVAPSADSLSTFVREVLVCVPYRCVSIHANSRNARVASFNCSSPDTYVGSYCDYEVFELCVLNVFFVVSLLSLKSTDIGCLITDFRLCKKRFSNQSQVHSLVENRYSLVIFAYILNLNSDEASDISLWPRTWHAIKRVRI